MQKYIDNFNDNIMHIRISGESGAGIPIAPKTILEEREWRSSKI